MAHILSLQDDNISYPTCMEMSQSCFEKYLYIYRIITSTDENLSLRIESFAIINLRGVSTKLYYTIIPCYIIRSLRVIVYLSYDLFSTRCG